jgi:hypothetical protein
MSSTVQAGGNAPFRGHGFLDLFDTANKQTLVTASIVVAVAWVPLAELSALRGGGSLASFLTDYSAQSRALIVIPALVIAEPALHARLTLVEHHFQTFLIPHEQLPKFRADWASSERLRNSKIARLVTLILGYAAMARLEQYLSPDTLMTWCKGGGGLRYLSPAGTWFAFVSYPILLYLVLLWLWRQLLWARFLRSTTRLNLCLVASHPDQLGGLGFIEASLRGQLPFSFCLGVGMAGAVANRVLHQAHSIAPFTYSLLVLVAGVLLICVAPYCVFIGDLLKMRRYGMLRYGAFARTVGEQFEKKWLDRADSLDEEVLTVPDFSTTTDLYGVVSNINNIRMVPVGAVDVYRSLSRHSYQGYRSFSPLSRSTL